MVSQILGCDFMESKTKLRKQENSGHLHSSGVKIWNFHSDIINFYLHSSRKEKKNQKIRSDAFSDWSFNFHL